MPDKFFLQTIHLFRIKDIFVFYYLFHQSNVSFICFLVVNEIVEL